MAARRSSIRPWSTTSTSGASPRNATTGACSRATRPRSSRSPTWWRSSISASPPPATPGGAYNSLTAQQRQQVADAKAIRQSQIGVVFPTTAAEGFKDTQPAFVREPQLQVQRSAVDLRVLAARREGRDLAVRQRRLERGGEPRRPTRTRSASRPCCSTTRWCSTPRCSTWTSTTTSSRCASSTSTPPT